MSSPHDIDNDGPLFLLDSFDTRSDDPHTTLGAASRQMTPRDSVNGLGMHTSSSIPSNTSPSGDSDRDTLADEDQFSFAGRSEPLLHEGQSVDKGKGPSRPLPIQRNEVGMTDDIFSMSPLEEGVSFADESRSGPSSPTTHSSPSSPMRGDVLHHENSSSPIAESHSDDFTSAYDGESVPIGGSDRKGKGKGVPPVLPPLTFTPGFEYSAMNWPTPSSVSTGAGSSSYASSYAYNSEPAQPESQRSPAISPPAPPLLTRVPSRRRSLSNLPIHSPRSPAERPVSGLRMKFEAPKGASNLARKLLAKRRDGPDTPSSDGSLDDTGMLVLDSSIGEEYGAGGCFAPWRSDNKFRPKSAIECTLPVLSYETAVVKGLASRANARTLRTQGRTYSCPISPLDIIDFPSPPDVFTPIQLPVRRPFDESLPRELKLHIFRLLVLAHAREHQDLVADGKWTALKASSSRNRWVGKDRGVRELIKLSRVSKSWRSLVFDGQLWSDLALSTFPVLPLSTVTNVVSESGAFLNGISLTGHASLSPESFFKLNHALCIPPALPDNQSVTQLRTINLQGCTSLTTRSLHDLLIRSPCLEKLCLKGLGIVINATCELLSKHCPDLTSLNISRCPNVDANGLRSMVAAATMRKRPLQLKELRIAGLKYITDDLMAALGNVTPYLEVLDLSYTRDLHNSAIDAFVSCPLEDTQVESVVLTSRDIGRDPGDVTKYRRRLTRLRHISLSYCLLLTDIACSNLAHCLPRLEMFEMAGIGSHLKDEGIIRMLDTTPLIRKLDLEDAMDISDAVLRTLTPVKESAAHNNQSNAPQLGQALEHLVISYAINVSNEAILGLIRNCPKLRVLEADSTRMTGNTMKEFVRLSRSRQMSNAGVVAIDCRSVGESSVSDISSLTRPRFGWRAHEAKKLAYLDARDEEDLGVGQDECDENRVVVKTFYSWETVDAVRSARDKKRKATKRAMNSSGSGGEDYFSAKSSGRARWWSPGGRLRSGNTSPSLLDINNDRDGCTIM